MATIKRELMLTVYAGLLVLSLYGAGAFSFSSKSISSFATLKPSSLKMVEERPSMDDGGPAGSFFHQVPESDENLSPEAASSNEIDGDTNDKTTNSSSDDDFDDAISKLIRQRRKPPRSSRLSTINGVPTEKSTGFGKTKQGKASGDSSISSSSSSSSSSTKKNPSSNKPYIAIGQPDNNQIKSQQPINDPSKPERDDQGYTLYTDTETGEKSRVFEALVEYPSIFTMVCLHIRPRNPGMNWLL